MVRRLLYLNGLAVLGAVLYHATAWGFIAMFWWTDRYREVVVPNFDAMGSLSYYGLRVVEQLIIFSIPAFLFVSGYFTAFAAGRTRDTIRYDVVWSRIKTLFIPYFVWSCIIIGLNWLEGRPTSPVEFITTILTGRATEAFYFIPVLIQLYLLAPLLLPWAKRRPAAFLVVAGVVQAVVMLMRYTQILGLEQGNLPLVRLIVRGWFFPGYIFWFAFGAVVGFHGQAIKKTLVKIRPLLLAALAILFVAGMFEWELLLRLSGEPWIGPRETAVDNLYSAVFLLVFIAFETTPLPQNRAIGQLGTRSFGVYLVHTLALIYTARIIQKILPQLLGYQLIFQIILIVAALAIPLTMMLLLDRSSIRKIYPYIFG